MKMTFVLFLAQSGSFSFPSLPYIHFMEDQKDLLGHIILYIIIYWVNTYNKYPLSNIGQK